MRTAFKEWAIVVDALGRGEQILILRKGGIAENRNGFQIDHPQFFLFPTLFHQQRESVTECARERFDKIAHAFPSSDIVRIEFLAEVAAWRRVESLSVADGLQGQHVWSAAVIANRFDWGHERNIFAMAVRVHRLALPIELPLSQAYGGCKSWVELDHDIPLTGLSPVLAEAEFDRKLQQFLAALNLATP